MSNVAQNLSTRIGSDYSSKLRVDAGLDNHTWASGAQTLAGQAATGGTGPYTYMWEVISGSGTFSDATSLTSTFSPGTLGGHVLRLTATDSAAATASDSITIEISSPWDLLGAYLKDYWISDAGISLVGGNVDTWTGQKLGIVLTAPAAGNRPTYGADTGYFNEQDVVQTATTGTKYLRNVDYGSDLYATGANCYSFAVCRLRSVPTSAAYVGAVLGLSNAGLAQMHFWYGASDTLEAVAGKDFGVVRDSGNVNRHTTGEAYSASAKMLEFWVDTGGNVRRNVGTTYNQAGANGIATDIGAVRSVSVGARPDGFAPTDYSIRAVALCTSKPPDAMISSVYNYFQTDSAI